jgi:hypothetical protein
MASGMISKEFGALFCSITLPFIAIEECSFKFLRTSNI